MLSFGFRGATGGRIAIGGFIPGHFCQHLCQSTEAGQAGKQQATADYERDNGKELVDRKGEQTA
jgi:hypothetical protein